MVTDRSPALAPAVLLLLLPKVFKMSGQSLFEKWNRYPISNVESYKFKYRNIADSIQTFDILTAPLLIMIL